MGKKGKKEKITGTPEVIKFKGTKEFAMLKECIAIQESLPFVASDVLDDLSFRKVARFLSMLGLLTVFVKADASKEYRFKLHHMLAFPPPQYFPTGYPASLIKVARAICASTAVSFNGRDFDYNEIAPELAAKSEEFLKMLDTSMTTLASHMEKEVKEDFPTGLKKFNQEFGKKLSEFDLAWVAYEEMYLGAKNFIDSEVLRQPTNLVEIEKKLTDAEDRLEIARKQEYENLFTREIEGIIHDNWSYVIGVNEELKSKTFYDSAVPLAEACIFYESKVTPEWLEQCKYVVKDYLELRIYVAGLPSTRLQLEFDKNTTFLRLLKKFHTSVHAAEEAFTFVDQLPKNTKQSNHMTRKLLEPDLIRLKKMTAAATS
ncbi:unnamed protein product [Amoebophrya sp. A120]|nr:unnamed protein product [Amoebophrya sp. A120]|eukprot:GSA120T00006702001.1